MISLRASSFAVIRRGLASYTVVLPDGSRAAADLANPHSLTTTPESGVRTSIEALYWGKSISGGSAPCLGWIQNSKYSWISYDQVIQKAQNVGKGLISLGINRSELVGLVTANRPECTIGLLACNMFSLTPVPVYETLSWDHILYIINQGEHRVVMCDTAAKARELLKRKQDMPSAKTLVCFEQLPEDIKCKDIRILEFTKLEQLGQQTASDDTLKVGPSPDDLFVICYTSGTTGKPKGAMISHKGMMASLSGILRVLGPHIQKGGKIISYLPNAHVYELYNQVISLHEGRSIGFFSGKIENLLDDILTLSPDHIPLVPRLMNRIYNDSISDIKKSPLKRFFFDIALRRKEELLKKGKISRKTIWDLIIFRDFQKKLGGNQKFIFTTSAPIAPDIYRLFKLGSGAHLVDGYGQTEVGCATYTPLYATAYGNVGQPLSCCHVKLEPAEDGMPTDSGEICIRGTNVFPGYFRNLKATAETIDKEGWLHTGDIGRWNKDGTLSIVDRKKHIFKLSQGEYIAPEKIESIYAQSNMVLQVFVDGNSDQDFPIAILVLDENILTEFMRRKGIICEDFNDLCKKKETRSAVLNHLNKLGKSRGLSGLEQVKNISIQSEIMTVAQGLITPTMKIRRANVRTHFRHLILDLYQEGPLE